METTWIWQEEDWPPFVWNAAVIGTPLAQSRLALGKVLGAAGLLDVTLSREAVAAILVEDGLTTSAIEGEQLLPTGKGGRSSAYEIAWEG